MDNLTVLVGDVRETLQTLPDKSVCTCVTSPPYFGLRDYGNDKQIGLEQTPEEYVSALVDVFREVKRVLRDDGTLWLNLGDSYAGSGRGPSGINGIGGQEKRQGFHSPSVTIPDGLKPKDLIGIPWRVAFALQADGWYLRQDIIWHKPNPMPESVTDRCTKAHEYVFLLSKSAQYYYDHEAIKEPSVDLEKSVGKRSFDGTRNKRSVWTITTKTYNGAHFATFPPDLIEPCILAGAPVGGVVLDAFGGSGTTAEVALTNNRAAIICELNPQYAKLIDKRTAILQPKLLIA